MRDLIWLTMLMGVMAVVTVNGLCHATVWRAMSITTPHGRGVAVVEVDRPAPVSTAADLLSQDEASLARLGR